MGLKALNTYAAGTKHQKYLQCSAYVGKKQYSMTSFICHIAAKGQPNMACSVSQSVVASSAAACTTASTGTPQAITGPFTETCNRDETIACQNLSTPSNDSRCSKGRNIAGFQNSSWYHGMTHNTTVPTGISGNLSEMSGKSQGIFCSTLVRTLLNF